MVMLYLRLSPARVSPSVTLWSRKWLQVLLDIIIIIIIIIITIKIITWTQCMSRSSSEGLSSAGGTAHSEP